MTTEAILVGGPQTPGERLAVWSLVVVAVFSLLGALWLDFAPAPGLGWPAYGIAVLLALLHGCWILAGPRRTGRYRAPSDLGEQLKAFVLAPLILGGFYWPLFFEILPAGWTVATGEPFVERFEMWTDLAGGARSRSCDYQLDGPPMGPLYASHLCISADTFARFPEGTAVIVELGGERSALGRYIRTIDVIGPADD